MSEVGVAGLRQSETRTVFVLALPGADAAPLVASTTHEVPRPFRRAPHGPHAHPNPDARVWR